jgi:hypothetical protein
VTGDAAELADAAFGEAAATGVVLFVVVADGSGLGGAAAAPTGGAMATGGGAAALTGGAMATGGGAAALTGGAMATGGGAAALTGGAMATGGGAAVTGALPPHPLFARFVGTVPALTTAIRFVCVFVVHYQWL